MSKLKIPSILIAVAIGLYLIFGWILKAQNPVMMNGGGGGSGGTSNQNLRTLHFVFDGGGTALVGSAQTCKHIPYSGTLTQLVLTSEGADGNPLSGTDTVDILTVSLANWISGTTPSTIHGAGSACTFTTTFGSNCSLTSWSTTIATDTVICPALSSPTNSVRVGVDVVISAN